VCKWSDFIDDLVFHITRYPLGGSDQGRNGVGMELILEARLNDIRA